MNKNRPINLSEIPLFDILATQGLMGDCFIPLQFQCSKLILVGDPHQLSPTVKSQEARENGLEQSLYNHLYTTLEGSCSITTLTVQYRMHKKICSFPNRTYYDGILETDPSIEHRKPNFGLRPIYYYNRNTFRVKDKEYGVIKNEDEAKFVVQLCCKLINHLHQSYKMEDNCRSNVEKQILIISPYQGQTHCIKELLKKEGVFNVEVITVDGVQGREKDFVIVSCVRDSDKIGFLNNKRRLNVALTRAKHGLYVVGNLKNLATMDDYWKKLVKDANDRNIISDTGNDQPTLPFCMSNIS
jgi:superfamily I DNA and/or RNA helicase